MAERVNPARLPLIQAWDYRRLLYRGGVIGIAGMGVWLRFFRLDAQRLWLDELYTADLVRGGLGTIWRTAFVDIVAPLSNLPFWLAGQMGGLSARSLRMTSVVASLVALAVFYRYCALVLDRRMVLTAAGLFALAPLAVYYAQEARPYALGLMGLLLTLLAYERLRQHDSRGRWAIYIVLAVCAAQFQYLNIALIGAQLSALVILSPDRRRSLIGGGVTVLAVAATSGPFIAGAAAVIGGWKSSGGLELASAMQTMAAGDIRFAPQAARLAAISAFSAGWMLAAADRSTWRTLLPHALQMAFSIMAAFVFLPLVGKFAPAYDERAFLLLLPSALVGFSLGIQSLLRRGKGRLLPVVLTAVVAVSSLAGLSNYFGGFIKSPEGQLIKAMEASVMPGDPVLTNRDAYSVDAALRFYRPDLPVYRFRREESGRWFGVSDPSILLILRGTRPEIELSGLMDGRRLWLIQRDAELPYLEFLLARYRVREEYRVAPFRAILLERR
jgi:hypothetical protein